MQVSNWIGVNMDVSTTIASLNLPGTAGNYARIQLTGPGTLTVTNPIALVGGEMLYSAPSGGNWNAPIYLEGGVLGWGGSSTSAYVATGGTVTGYSGTSYLGFVSSSGPLVVNSGATVCVTDTTNFPSTPATATFTSTTVNSGGTLTSGVAGSTLGGPVNVTGGTLAGTVTYSGAVTATSGTSTISGGTLGSTLAVNSGATLNVNGSISPASGSTVIGALQGSGTLGNAVSLTGGTLAGTVTYSGAVTATSGTSTISGGTAGFHTGGQQRRHPQRQLVDLADQHDGERYLPGQRDDRHRRLRNRRHVGRNRDVQRHSHGQQRDEHDQRHNDEPGHSAVLNVNGTGSTYLTNTTVTGSYYDSSGWTYDTFNFNAGTTTCSGTTLNAKTGAYSGVYVENGGDPYGRPDRERQCFRHLRRDFHRDRHGHYSVEHLLGRPGKRLHRRKLCRRHAIDNSGKCQRVQRQQHDHV